ncbi:ninein-like protein isoform X2 [Melanotaenia boesemani]|uniref:ninein-like protein isoform X2 n=1 Tax=Melanotaenia boesemani TaxID=1250792 RepID=UPI001C047D93|nr:ninein-like protein isoform X2 [Melanotaenia boesemani]
MEEAEHSRYVTQLKAEFDSCDTTATGFLDRDELTELCRKLQLDAHLPLLLDTLLGERTYGRVNFEEFKEGFVAVLSRSLDFSTSEDDSSYLEPAVPEEVKPKFVKGTKRYGRRSRPDSKLDAVLACDSEDSPPSRTEPADLSPPGVRRAKLRRATSLESVESLKSDEETGSQKNVQPLFQNKGEQQEEELEVGGSHHVMTAVCDHLGLQHLHTQDMDVLLRRLDADLDGRVSIREFKKVLCSSTPFSSSTPTRSTDIQRAPYRSQAVLEELSARSASPSLLTATVGQRVLSWLDDGSGCTSPERVAALWTEEGIRNSRDILQTLDFPLEERLSLADLTLALDNELLVSGNGIHQAALISYKNEIQHLQEVAEQACRERDKLKADLDVADQRNLQLVREVDDRHASMETLNESRIRDLEQDFRDRLMTLRCQSEQESEVLLQQVEREHQTLQDELQLLRVQEVELQEELCSMAQENRRLMEELSAVKLKLTEAESSVSRLQGDLNQLLHDKLGSLDAAGAGLSHEERFSEFIKEYELQCRELRDRNDELSSELELLKSNRKSRQTAGDADALSWSRQRAESDSDDSDMKRSLSPARRRKLQPDNKTALCSLDDVSGPAVSIQTELAVEQLKQKHEQELQQLNIQLETQVNYYERSLEKMRQSMEVERKDICQAFKLEISELEEQKSQVEQQVKELKEALDKLQIQIHQGGGGWSNEQERRMQRDRAELETNFAREISNLVQKLSSEKDQLEAELKLKMDQEVMAVREESNLQLSQVKLQNEEEVQHLEEQVSGLQEAIQKSGQTEAMLEEDLEASRRRCSELEARLEEACTQLEDSIMFLESQDLLNKHLASEKSAVEEELHQAKTRADKDLVQVSQLKAELEDLRAASDILLQDREAAANNCSRLSGAFIQQQVQLRAKEQTITSLRSELENLQEALRTRIESVSRLIAELDSLKMDRDRLIQDLKDQAMAVDNLQLELDSVSEELDRRRSSEVVLQEALKQEQNQTLLLRSSLAEETEEVHRLSQENSTYIRLVDQLSTQIVEMEEEISSLRDHLRGLSSQLNGTADLVLDLRKQLNSKTSDVDLLRAEATERQARSASEQLEVQNGELDQVREQVRYLQQALQDSQNQLRSAEEDFEREKGRMAQQLMELERLVLDLEDVMDPTSPHRTQLEEVRSENAALQEKLSVLQQEVQNLEDDLAKKRRRLEEMEREHKRSREEEERLHKENSKYREEVLDLSSRNLQLSSDNSELSARLHGEQESVRMLRERLATVSREHEEEEATVRWLQDAMTQQEREKLQQQTGWKQEKKLLERELSSTKEKLGRQSQLEAELSSVTLKLQWVEEDKERLQRDVDDRNNKVEKLQQQLMSLETEAELLRSQLHAVTQERVSHAQEVMELQEAHSKVEELEVGTRRLIKEKEELSLMLKEQEEQASVTLQEETHKLRVQNQELQHQLSELQIQDLQVHKLTQEQQNLKSKLTEVEAARMQAQDQAVRADAALSVVQAQQLRQLHELQEQAGGRKEAELLQERLEEEMRKSQELEEALQLQAQQSSSQISVKQEQYEKAAAALEQRVEDLEIQLKGIRLVLQEKVQQLKEQMAKSSKASALLKDLYVENSQLMKALQVTEQRQKNAEKKNFLLEEKVGALNKLLREIVPAALAT